MRCFRLYRVLIGTTEGDKRHIIETGGVLMRIVKWLLKLPTLMLMLINGIVSWIASFAVAMSHWLFYVTASLLFLLGFVCLIFQQATLREIVPLLVLSFVLYILPHVAIGIIGGLAGINARLRWFVQS